MINAYTVVWSKSTFHDLANIIEYIAEGSPANARKTAAKIKKEVSELYHSPLRGRCVPELQGQGILLYRELVSPYLEDRVSGFRKECIGIVTVIRLRQNVEDILLKKITISNSNNQPMMKPNS